MQIAILGPLECRRGEVDPVGDGIVDVPGARVRSLAVRLAFDPGRPVSYDELVDAIWHDEPPTNAPNALQSLVSRLRRALGNPGLVQQTSNGYRLDVKPEDVDAYRFEGLARSGRELLRAGEVAQAAEVLSDALRLWRGLPLEDAGDADYTWAPRARWSEERLLAVVDRIDAELRSGLASDVLSELEELVTEYPTREALVGLQMRALAAVGRTADALTAYERLRSRLADDLGTNPSGDLQDVHLAVLRGEVVAMVSEPDGPTNLPLSVSTFIGREAEAKRVDALLGAGRLVTIVGPGGAGKTRLATEVAETWRRQMPDGVWLVELAPVGADAEVVDAFLDALGLREVQVLDRASERQPAQPIEILLARLETARCLLVVDNCEHLVDAVATLVDGILAACPYVTVLATSREPLGIGGEALCMLPPLEMPDEGATVEDAAERPSVRLFVERAEAVDADFVLDVTTVGSVVGIVRRLDGLPLAIELAAARLRVLPVDEVLRRLADRFRLLTGGSRTAMPRHRTLRAVVEWSWGLLSDEERLLAERLAVFPSGATVSSATAICSGDQLAADEIPDLLSALVDKSLLKRGDGDRLRYRMLETIREYGVERLGERGELEGARAAHAHYFRRVVRDLEPRLRTTEQLEALDTLSVERDNIIAAVRYLGDAGEANATLAMVLSLSWYWTMLGHHTEAARWLRFALAVDGEVDPRNFAAADAILAISELAEEDADTTGATWETRMTRLRLANDRLEEDRPPDDSLLVLLQPMMAYFGGDPELAEELNERALHSRDPWIRAAVHTMRANLFENEGRIDEMRADLATTLAELDDIGDRWLLGSTLAVRGRVRTLDGDLDGAIEDLERARGYLAEIKATDDESFIALRLAELKLRLGDTDGARVVVEGAFPRGSAALSTQAQVFQTAMLASIARQTGDMGESERLHETLRGYVEAMPAEHPLQGHGRAILLAAMAMHDVAAGRVQVAANLLADAYAVSLGTHDQPIVAMVGVAVAALAEAVGRPDDAAEVLGAAAVLRGSADDTDVEIAALTTRLRAALGDRFDVAFGAGEGLSRDDALHRLDPALLTGA